MFLLVFGLSKAASSRNPGTIILVIGTNAQKPTKCAVTECKTNSIINYCTMAIQICPITTSFTANSDMIQIEQNISVK